MKIPAVIISAVLAVFLAANARAASNVMYLSFSDGSHTIQGTFNFSAPLAIGVDPSLSQLMGYTLSDAQNGWGLTNLNNLDIYADQSRGGPFGPKLTVFPFNIDSKGQARLDLTYLVNNTFLQLVIGPMVNVNFLPITSIGASLSLDEETTDGNLYLSANPVQVTATTVLGGTTAPTPEPSVSAQLAIGLLGLGILRGRMNKSKRS